MAGTNTAKRERRRLGLGDARPRPVSQSLWLLGSIGLAGLALVGAARSLPAQSLGQRIAPEDLLITAGDEGATGGGADVPASPTIGLETTADVAAGDTSGPTSGPATDDLGPTDDPEPVDDGGPADDGALTDEERDGRQALAEIDYPWEQLLPGWTIDFLPERDGFYGLTLVPEQRIEIYVRPEQSPRLLAHVIAHELGHAVDVSLNDGPDRRRWEDQRGFGSSPWWPGTGATDFSTGAGDFAESFAAWQVGEQDFRSNLGGPPDRADIELLAELSSD
jgi:hypothetical protein